MHYTLKRVNNAILFIILLREESGERERERGVRAGE